MDEEFPTISSESGGMTTAVEPEEDLSSGGYTSALGYSAANKSAEFMGITGPVARPEEIKEARQQAFLKQKPLEPDEAALLYQRLPFMEEAERSQALPQLNRYAVDLEQKEAAERETERHREFLDPSARTAWLDQPEVKNNLGYLDDSDTAYDRMAVRKFLETDVYKRKLADSEYEAARNDLGRRLAGKPRVSDQEAFGIIQKEVELEKEYGESLKFMSGEMMKQKIEAAQQNKPFRKGDVWDATRKAFPKSSEKHEAHLYQAVEDENLATENQYKPFLPQMAVFKTYLEKSMADIGSGGGPTPEDTAALVEAAKTIPPALLEPTLKRTVAAIQHGQADKGQIQKAWHNLQRDIRIWSGVKPMVKGLTYTAKYAEIEMHRKAMEAAFESGTARIDEQGNISLLPDQAGRRGYGGYQTEAPKEKEGLRVPTAEEKAQALKSLDDIKALNFIDGMVERVFESTLGAREHHLPPDFWGGWPLATEKAFYGAREQAPQMVLMSLNAPIYLATVGSQAFREITLDNPDIDPGVALAMAGTEAAINWITDHTQLKGLSGLGGVRQVLSLTRRIPGGKIVARGVGIAGYETATEWAQDLSSELGKKAVQEIIYAINPNASVGQIKSLQQIQDEFYKNMGQTAGQMFFLSAIGVGVLTHRDIIDPAKNAYSYDNLRAEGILEDDITALQFEADFDERASMFQTLLENRTPEQINDGILYQQKLREQTAAAIMGKPEPGSVEAAEEAEGEEPFKPPTLVPHIQPDGTRLFTLKDGNGVVIRENMDEGVAAMEWADAYEQGITEHRQKQIDEAATAKEVARNAAAETKWRVLDARERTTLGNIVEFSHVEQSPEQQRTISKLREAIKARGIDTDPVVVSVDNPATKAGRSAVNFIRWFEGTFGKRVVFVASETGQPLPFDGVVNSSDPNTIFLNASGDRNVLSLLGHEWSHTLETTNKGLWKEVMERMKPLVVDWAKQTGKIDKSYSAEEADSEFVANIIGDAFGDTEFWRTVRERHSGLFMRLIEAIQDWFDTIVDNVTEWGTQSPDVISDIKGMRNLIAETIERAREPAEEAPGAPTVITPEMISGLKAIGFDDAMIAGLTPTQAAYYLEPPRAQLSVRVHHGTKTKGIKEWVLDFLGSGEGNAAFGWGLYMAENPDVARRYRNLLGGKEITEMVGQEAYDPLNPTHIIAEWLFQYGEDQLGRTQAVERALAANIYLRNYGKPGLEPQTPEQAAAGAAYQLLAKLHDELTTHTLPAYRREERQGGTLYTLDLDVVRGQALDLDRRMDDQSPYVMEKILASGVDYDPKVSGKHFQDKTLLKRYYEQMLAEKWKHDPNKDMSPEKQAEFEGRRRVSMFLKSIGIPANTFADNFSRAAWQSALQTYYEGVDAHRSDMEDYKRYGAHGPAYIEQAQMEIDDAKDQLIEEERRLKTTRNWVLWEPERLKDAPERERLQFAMPREEAGHKFGTRGTRTVDENGGYIEDAETLKIEQSINEQLDKKKLKGAERKRVFALAREQVITDIKSTRARNPDASTGAPDPWSKLEVTGSAVEDKGDNVVKAVATWKGQNYRFDEVPEGMTRDQWRHQLAGLVMKQFIERLQKGYRKDATPEERRGAELILREIEWYRDFIHKLRGEFGGASDFMADLLGAYSPRQNVQLNVRNAMDTIWAISQGKYDVLLRDLDAYMKADPKHTIATWRKDDGRMMRARSDALFGTNTERGMMAALGLWREIQAMDAPKAKNFTRNLIGLSIKATIDVWAARLLDRVAGKPRIPVEAEGAVQGQHLSQQERWKAEPEQWAKYGPENLSTIAFGDIPVKGQFGFGQEVFAQVAEMMKDPATWADTGLPQKVADSFKKVTPSDVQAMNWFVEKEIWTERDWTNDAGAGGSFMHEIEQHLGTRFQVGLSQQISGRAGVEDFLPQDADQARFIQDVHDDLIQKMPEALALRVMDSLGMFKGFGERSLDLELTHGPGLEPNDLLRIALYHAWSKDQEATHVSRVMEPWETIDDNIHRPGIEIYLKQGSGIEALNPLMKMLEKRGLNGFTLIVDPRAKMGSKEYLGIRLQYVPEYSGDGKEWAKKGKNKAATIDRAIKVLETLDAVAYAKRYYYDTVVFQKGIDYDNEGQNPGALGTVEAGAWRRRYFDYMAQKAVRRDEREALLGEHDEQVSHREPTAREGQPTGLAPPGQVAVNTFDRDSRTFGTTPMQPTKALLKRLRKEASVYSQLLECMNA